MFQYSMSQGTCILLENSNKGFYKFAIINFLSFHFDSRQMVALNGECHGRSYTRGFQINENQPSW